MNDTNSPITGICLITKPTNVPTGYECIRKAFDDQTRDADLMADSILERKDRFICITRCCPPANVKSFVLEDIKLINERDSPHPPYEAITQTIDTNEKATVKRTFCVKMTERQAGMKCICDIIFLYRTKRPPQFYTLIGEIKGFQMCVKEGTVPSYRAPPPSSSNLYPNPIDGQFYSGSAQQHYHPMEYSNTQMLSKKSDEKEILDGIPFEINPKYLEKNRNGTNHLFRADALPVLSSYEIEQNFNYDFTLERSYRNI